MHCNLFSTLWETTCSFYSMYHDLQSACSCYSVAGIVHFYLMSNDSGCKRLGQEGHKKLQKMCRLMFTFAESAAWYVPCVLTTKNLKAVR